MKSLLVVLTIIVLVTSAVNLTACSSTGTILDGTDWMLESYGEQGNLQTLLPSTEITTSFDGTTGQVTGSTGCNTYFSNYNISGSNISFSDIAATEMYCESPEGVMGQEREFLDLLRNSATFVMTKDKLTISISDGQILIFIVKEVS